MREKEPAGRSGYILSMSTLYFELWLKVWESKSQQRQRSIKCNYRVTGGGIMKEDSSLGAFLGSAVKHRPEINRPEQLSALGARVENQLLFLKLVDIAGRP